ncbi:cupin domain-containing protein [Paraburkholderia sp. BL9I2N2]|uniref:cupin domain-containing protein n=1 Tax=Paraburkholderia sp. BL9I2N2 TaxID=1938809 RepID=UPI0010508C24|nr:cupin domain-containing protein [Paraburkholderia sp. BL9I2N2]TCK84361.1 cupin [Paraburkholderia sp. BL9I2N2]
MNSIDSLIFPSRLQGAVDLLYLAGDQLQENRPAVTRGEACYYVMTSGSCALVREGVPDELLSEGDIVLLARGSAHKLAVSREAVMELSPCDERHIVFNGNATARPGSRNNVPSLNLLCGRITDIPSALLFSGLPDLIKVSYTDHASPRLRQLIEIILGETERARPGASFILAEFSVALFAMILRVWLELIPVTEDALAQVHDAHVAASASETFARPAEP